jgi:hypothetical protein
VRRTAIGSAGGLAGRRFGPLFEAVQQMVRAARTERLDVWADRVLTATSLDEVLVDRLASPFDPFGEVIVTIDETFAARGRVEDSATMTTAELLYARGYKYGYASVLLEALARRFGPFPATVEDIVRAAEIDQLDLWADRILTAESVDEVLA